MQAPVQAVVHPHHWKWDILYFVVFCAGQFLTKLVQRVEPGELSEVLTCGCVVRSNCIPHEVEGPEPLALPLVPYASNPSTASNGYSPQPMPIKPRVVSILGVAAPSQILASIVERITVTMVSLLCLRTAENKPVHQHECTTAHGRINPSSVETTRARIPLRIPIPLREPLKVCGIDRGDLVLRKRNKSVRFVEWLDNWVAFHGTLLGHRSSSQGLLLSSHCPTLEYI